MKAVIFDMYETLITQYRCPVYFTPQMAADAGITPDQFRPIWIRSEHQRTLGYETFENVIACILRENHVYSEETYRTIIRGRIEAKKKAFDLLHEEILPMLDRLKEMGMKVALISNCYNEEQKIIRESCLFPYFDAVCLSCEEHISKPEPEIFERMLAKLGVKSSECLYIGDGGSQELQAASAAGMKAMQALWYLEEQNYRQGTRYPEYRALHTPMEIIGVCTEEC